MDSSNPTRNRRSLRNLFIYPLGQVRFIFIVPVTVSIALATVLLTVKSSLLMNLDAIPFPPQADYAALRERLTLIFDTAVGFTFLAGGLTSILGLVVSHRFYGPVVPIVRTILRLKEGTLADRVHLRKGDELAAIAKAVNELAESLEAKTRAT